MKQKKKMGNRVRHITTQHKVTSRLGTLIVIQMAIQMAIMGCSVRKQILSCPAPAPCSPLEHPIIAI